MNAAWNEYIIRPLSDNNIPTKQEEKGILVLQGPLLVLLIERCITFIICFHLSFDILAYVLSYLINTYYQVISKTTVILLYYYIRIAVEIEKNVFLNFFAPSVIIKTLAIHE